MIQRISDGYLGTDGIDRANYRGQTRSSREHEIVGNVFVSRDRHTIDLHGVDVLGSFRAIA